MHMHDMTDCMAIIGLDDKKNNFFFVSGGSCHMCLMNCIFIVIKVEMPDFEKNKSTLRKIHRSKKFNTCMFSSAHQTDLKFRLLSV